ncbi:MAG: hypothetical protein F9K27_06505 [Anaerolineae bacterium]|nr:MAG: hypothetical protein F9K27_06505 [Anaerolineae bacterium]
MPLTLFILAVAAALLSGLIGWLAVHFMVRSRNQASFWRQRRRAGRRAYNLSLLAALLLGCSLVFCLASWVSTMIPDDNKEDSVPPVVSVPTATPSYTPTTTASPAPSITPAILIPVTFTPTVTSVPNTVAPSQVIPSVMPVTPTLILPTLPATPMPTVAAASEIVYAELRLVAVDDAISDTWQVVEPDSTFPEGVQRLYFYFSYEQITTGTELQKTLLRNGETLMDRTDSWGVGESSGETFFFFGQDEGFMPGNYEFRITQSDQVLVSTLFTIEPAQ